VLENLPSCCIILLSKTTTICSQGGFTKIYGKDPSQGIAMSSILRTPHSLGLAIAATTKLRLRNVSYEDIRHFVLLLWLISSS
jgi:hypothetical protein